MKLKTSDLYGAFLDICVAYVDPMCHGLTWKRMKPGGPYIGYSEEDGESCAYLSSLSGFGDRLRIEKAGIEPYAPSADWRHGGRIIEQNNITLIYYGEEDCVDGNLWEAQVSDGGHYIDQTPGDAHGGPTPLVAACRAFVASKLGDEVEVPEDLVSL